LLFRLFCRAEAHRRGASSLLRRFLLLKISFQDLDRQFPLLSTTEFGVSSKAALEGNRNHGLEFLLLPALETLGSGYGRLSLIVKHLRSWGFYNLSV
jgi:hypothetical protein